MTNLFSLCKKFMAALLLCACAHAGDDALPRFYPYDNGLGAGGYDIVAYFTEGAAVEGKASQQEKFAGAVWYFSSAENREKFLASPEKYLPRYGGYCAYAAALDALAFGDPTIWSIRDGALYFNYNAPTRDTWLLNADVHIRHADQNWPALSRR